MGGDEFVSKWVVEDSVEGIDGYHCEEDVGLEPRNSCVLHPRQADLSLVRRVVLEIPGY